MSGCFSFEAVENGREEEYLGEIAGIDDEHARVVAYVAGEGKRVLPGHVAEDRPSNSSIVSVFGRIETVAIVFPIGGYPRAFKQDGGQQRAISPI